MSNGACWDIDTLIRYIKSPAVNGQNIGKSIKQHMATYPSDQLWIDDDDYKTIINHPKAKVAGLEEFIESRRIAQHVVQIPQETLNQLRDNGSIMWSRGPPFDTALRALLTPEELTYWNDVSSHMHRWELPDAIRNAKLEPDLKPGEPVTVQVRIKGKIQGLKADATRILYKYLQSRPKAELDAIEMISPDFMYTIQNCYAG